MNELINLFTTTLNLGNHWEDESNRREFFGDFAAVKGIDPLNAEAWHKVTAGSILATKVVVYILHFVSY
jgi:hypothetical protein